MISATLDGARVAKLLGDAPVVESQGRAFPVETRYRPRDPLKRIEDQVTDAVLVGATLTGADGVPLAGREISAKQSPGGVPLIVPLALDRLPHHADGRAARACPACFPACILRRICKNGVTYQ